MSQFKCPKCGAQLKVIPLASNSTPSSCLPNTCLPNRQRQAWRVGQTFGLGADVPKGTTYSKETPVVDMSGIEAGFKTPLFQSSITALAGGALAVVGVVWQGWHWSTPIAVVVVVFGISWYFLLTGNRRLLSVVETIDPPEAQQPTTFNVEVTESFADGQKRMVFAQFPASERDTRRFAIAALNHRLTVHGGHRLSRRTFEQMRDESISRGLVAWVNADHHNQGVRLTRVGARVFKHLSD